MSFSYKEIKYFCPFYKDEEFWIKPKYFTKILPMTILDILSDMFRRHLLDKHSGKATTEKYWRSIIEEQHRVAVLLIFSDRVYQQYPSLEKPSKQATDHQDAPLPPFVTINRANTLVPNDLLGSFWPKNLTIDRRSVDDILRGIRLKVRISKQHIHPRSIVLPYEPRVVFEDDNLIAVNKPFGIPSMGETNDIGQTEWNSILTWCRFSTVFESGPSGRKCDLMNRLDLDVSGLVLLGKSGTYRKKRGFGKETKLRGPGQPGKTIKVYLGIIPKQKQALRITTPRLEFDKKSSKATIKLQQPQDSTPNHAFCRTSIYPLIDLNGGIHSLVAICLEESGQRHQIRFHLSLIDAAITNDDLYSRDGFEGGTPQRRTGVSSAISSVALPPSIQRKTETKCVKDTNPLVHVEQIDQDDSKVFLQSYVYNNGVIGFQETDWNGANRCYKRKLIQRTLYPCRDERFSELLKAKFDLCQYCGKCAALQEPESSARNQNASGTTPKPLCLDHGIFLHSWRYFYPTLEHYMLEADLTGSVVEGRTCHSGMQWWPVRIVKG
eukprot:scaffold681_cov130-Cylindrotheca_fusiformis.AAC.2